MTIMNKAVGIAVLGALLMAASAGAHAQKAMPGEPIARAPSTPDTPKNWAGPGRKIKAQAIVDRLMASHPEIQSITIHAVPAGLPADGYTMIAGSFPDRIGNKSSPGDIITAKKGVTQVESKWGTENYGKKVSIVLPLKNSKGDYLPAAMVIAFNQSPTSGMIDTDFMVPGIAIRDGLNGEIASFNSLFQPAK